VKSPSCDDAPAAFDKRPRGILPRIPADDFSRLSPILGFVVGHRAALSRLNGGFLNPLDLSSRSPRKVASGAMPRVATLRIAMGQMLVIIPRPVTAEGATQPFTEGSGFIVS
jgi:hypothetical protein